MKIAVTAIVLAAVVLSLAVYTHLPAKVPTHWNAAGQVDGYSSRMVGAFLLPGVMLAFAAMFAVLPAISPRGFDLEGKSKAYRGVVIALLLFLFAIHVQLLLAAFGRSGSMTTFLPILIGALFVVLGNYLPKFRRNFFVGIRTPWTLADEDVWFRTHRFGGVLFVIAGVALMVVGPFLAGGAAEFVVIGLVVAASLGSAVYSFVIYRRTVGSKDEV